MKGIFFVSLCFLNFLPVWVIVILLDAKSIWLDHSPSSGAEWCGVVGILIGLLVSTCLVVLGLSQKNAEAPDVMILKSVSEQKSLAADVLLSYVLPLLAFEMTTWLGLTQFLVFFFLIAALSYRHKHVSGNVVLELFGYRFYACADDRDAESLVLTRRYLGGAEGMEIKVHQLNDQVYCEVRT